MNVQSIEIPSARRGNGTATCTRARRNSSSVMQRTLSSTSKAGLRVQTSSKWTARLHQDWRCRPASVIRMGAASHLRPRTSPSRRACAASDPNHSTCRRLRRPSPLHRSLSLLAKTSTRRSQNGPSRRSNSRSTSSKQP